MSFRMNRVSVISPESSRKIAMWSFVFAVLVVIIHCRWGMKPWVNGFVSVFMAGGLAQMAVPFFFVVAGYFIACHVDEDGWWCREIGKRMKTLMVPYVIWTLVLAVILFVETGVVLGPGILGVNLSRLPLIGPLWFIRCLMLFLVTTPVLASVIDRVGCIAALTAYLAWLGFSVLNTACQWHEEGGFVGFLRYGYSVEGLVYYMTGLTLRRRGPVRVAREMAWLFLVLGTVITVGAYWAIAHGVALSMRMSALVTPLLLIGLWKVVRPLPLPSFLTGCAFPIYIMHGVVLAAMRHWGGSSRPCNPWFEFLAGVFIPMAFYNLVRRFLPRSSSVLFGGR